MELHMLFSTSFILLIFTGLGLGEENATDIARVLRVDFLGGGSSTGAGLGKRRSYAQEAHN
jgi:hypothetical protein